MCAIKNKQYEFKGNNKVYYPDFFIASLNLVVEIKSSRWYVDQLDKNLKKQQVTLDSGYGFIFIIDKNYAEFDSILKRSGDI